MAAAADASKALHINSIRISSVASRLAVHIQHPPRHGGVEFFHLCLALARGIDYAVANKNIPTTAQELPQLLKQVCQRKTDPLLQAGVMVLMLSVKSACNNRWFLDKDTDELCMLAKEIGSSFCSETDINTEANTLLSTISMIMSRFYPIMKMGDIIAFLEVKPGYGAFLTNFDVVKKAECFPEEEIRLFVAQTDSINTSSCIISPQQVNFLINGKGVPCRTNVLLDTGPQIPSNLKGMLNYGTNILQAVGQFNGNYIIAVAYMSVIATPNYTAIPDYVQPACSVLDSDFDVIEGPSRISLNCPISFRRIKVPIKGHSCKHLQCFDFLNYLDINSRRPSWRCPHCNQYVCFTDIRIDQNMVKVLQEVLEKVDDVIIHADGSWKAVLESDDNADQLNNNTINGKQDANAQNVSTNSSNAIPNILDLTEESDVMDADGYCENEDRKPILATSLNQADIGIQTPNSLVTNNTSEINQSAGALSEDDFWSGIDLVMSGLGASGTRSDAPAFNNALEPAPSLLLSPILTDAVSPALNRGTEALHRTPSIGTFVPLGQNASPESFPFQLAQFDNSIVGNEYGRFSSMPMHVQRTPIAVQALPVPNLTSVSQQRLRNNMNTFVQIGPSAPSQTSPGFPLTADGFGSVSNNGEWQQQLSRSHATQFQASHMASSSLLLQPTTQLAGRLVQSQMSSAYGAALRLPTGQLIAHQQEPQNFRIPHPTGQSSSVVQSSVQLPSRFPATQGVSQVGAGQTTGRSSQQAPLIVTAQQAAQRTRPAVSTSVPIQNSRIPSSHPMTAGGSRDLSEQNWQPTGRMRGSLSGHAYSAALGQYLSQPTQPVQAARPPLTTPLPGHPLQMHVLLANNRNVHAPQTSHPSAGSGSVGGSSTIQSGWSEGSH